MSLTITQPGHHTEARLGLRSTVARATVLTALITGLAAGFLAGQPGAPAAVAAAGEDLARLLRAMAALKLLFVAASAAAILWRLQAPTPRPQLALYSLAIFAMAAGPGLIWTMTHVALGAALLHAGLLAALLLLWRDPAVGSLLSTALNRRRAKV